MNYTKRLAFRVSEKQQKDFLEYVKRRNINPSDALRVLLSKYDENF